MLPVIPLPPLVLGVNILCRLFTCKYPFPNPEIVYGNDKELVSVSRYAAEEVVEDGSYYDVANAPEPNIIETKLGSLEGYYMVTSGGRKIGAFEGIKYAVAERWERSTPIGAWDGLKNAKSPGSDCLQINVRKYFKIYGSEDCLFLNVYTPVISGNKKEAKLPVVVYIHGGSFLFGAGQDHGPAYLLNEDIVLVNFNYRLGVLGDKHSPGNYGLKDQRLAIHWVKDNIANFGGDPNQITLWGYSAGAVSVHLHYMMSNGSKDLFNRGISNGGTAFTNWGVHPPWRARQYTEHLAKYFRCPTKDSKAMVDCLKKVDPTAVVSAQVHLVEWFPFPPVVFVPTTEYGDSDEPFLTDMPVQLYKEGKVEPKPWIVSTTKHEGLSAVLVLELMQRWGTTKLFWNRVGKHVLDLSYLHLSNVDKMMKKITKFYFGDKLTTQATAFEYSNMISDRYFNVPIAHALQAHSQISDSCYSYIFSYSNGSYSLGEMNLHRPQEWGASHAEDEGFFFNSTFYYPGFKRTDPEYELGKIMLNFVTNFVISGKPTLTQDGKTLNVWKPVRDPNVLETLIFDQEISMASRDLSRVKFWENINLPDIPSV